MPLLDREYALQVLGEHQDLQGKVSFKKYQLKDKEGNLLEEDFSDVLVRVCRAFRASVAGKYPDNIRVEIEDMIAEGRFIPGGSILSGLGNTQIKSSLSNCYLIKIENDSIEGIFEAAKKMARTYSYRGGCGVDITVLRPDGDPVNNAALASTGAVSFMPIFAEVTARIGQHNSKNKTARRGAMLISMDVRHPDTPKFIWAKSAPDKVFPADPLTGRRPELYDANISVKLTDEFMEAVRDDKPWRFRFPVMDLVDCRLDSIGASSDPQLGTLIFHEDVLHALDLRPGDTFETVEGYQGDIVSVTPEGAVNVRFSENYNAILHPPRVLSLHLSREDGAPNRKVYDKLWDGDYDKWEKVYGQPCKIYGEMTARQLLKEIAEAAHRSGDPGVLFLDTMQKWTTGTYVHPSLTPTSANPCAEQPLAPWNNCLLGAMVLHRYVKNPWTSKAEFDIDAFLADVRRAVYFLDAMVEINKDMHPLMEQRNADAFGRRIGLEFTGLADMLAMLGIWYGSPEAITFLDGIFKEKARVEIETSCELAEKYGPAPCFMSNESREGFLNSPYVKRLGLSEELQGRIKRFGLSNAAFNTAGPCGSISVMSDNCTSGIEPVFKFSYTRRTRLDDKVFTLVHLPPIKWLLDNPEKAADFYGFYVESSQHLARMFHYMEAGDLKPEQRLDIQAVVQKYTDAGISSTLNLPRETTVEEIAGIYRAAWEKGLKGVTVFRDGCKEGVLGAVTPAPQTATPVRASAGESYLVEKELLDTEQAERHRVIWKGTKLYVIVSLDENDRPVEVFTKMPREAGINGNGIYSQEMFQENISHWDTICRLTSLLLRVSTPLDRVLKQFDRSSYSLVDAAGILSRILRKYEVAEAVEAAEDDEVVEQGLGLECPDCGAKALVPDNGCKICKACGYTTCG